jgi:hypothetical protein
MFKFFFFLLTSLQLIHNQLTEYKIATEVEDTIETNKYYMLALDATELTPNSTLVIYIKPSNNYEQFSDPDLYASVKNYHPNSYFTSEWRSTNLGRDIITIPGSELQDQSHIYVGITCSKVCKYSLRIVYQSIVELDLGANSVIHFGNDTSYVLQYVHRPESPPLAELYSIGTKYSDFQIKVYYMVGDGLNHELSVYTTWTGGFSSLIDTGVYFDCPKCYFKIVITSKAYNIVQLGLRSANVTDTLSLGKKTFGSLLQGMMDCYFFNETLAERKSNKFIFYGNSYRNTVNLSIRTSSDLSTIQHSIIPTNPFNFALTVQFKHEELMGKYLCLAGDDSYNFNSYMFTMLRIEDIENFGEFTLYSGIMQQGYLPPGQAVSYLLHTNTVDNFKSMAMNLQVNKGKPVMYGIFCTDIQCRFSGSTLKNEVNLIQTPLINGEYNLQVTPDMNRCNMVPDVCHTVMVVYCDGSVECEYHVTMTIERGELYLPERYGYVLII